MERTLFLFDIDGTLLHAHGAGRTAFIQAIRDILGKEDPLDYIHFAGTTDRLVLRRITDRHGISFSEPLAERFFAAMTATLEQIIHQTPRTVFPGVPALLDALSAHPQALLGLVTGNIASCARIKLASVGLHHHFPFGGFGDDHDDRAEIAHRARDRAQACLAPGETLGACYLIGDTPSDIHAARAIGATAIAVATGVFGVEALRDAGADIVFPSFIERDRVLAALGLAP